MRFALGIDQGTTQTTAVIVDEQGKTVARHSVQLPIRFPQPGWVEQDPWEILATVRQAVAPLLERYPVDTIGFDNQGETFLLWDSASGQPLTPAIVWQDQRGVPVCEQLAGGVQADWLRHKTGLMLDSYFSAPKLRFALDQDPALCQRAANGEVRFGTTETWVLWQLSQGRLHVTDPSTASRTLLFDINRLGWDEDLLGLFDVSPLLLPKVVPSAGYVGELDFGTGQRYSLHALLVDQQAALFGQSCFAPGTLKCTFGTGTFLLMNTGQQPRLSNHGLLSTVAWQVADHTAYALDGGDFAAGAAVQWLVENLAVLPDAAASEQAAQQAQDESLIFVPALAGLAAPHWQTQARGTFFGISRATTQADLVRATLKGIACRVYDIAKALEQDAGYPLADLKVDGGPSANRYLMQFLADILDIEVKVAAEQEATAVGVANLAIHAARGVSLDEIGAQWQAQAVYRPQMASTVRQNHLERWHRALAAVKQFYQ